MPSTLAPLLLLAACITNGGQDTGSFCQLPFVYKGVRYNGCILVDAGDGKPWCSTSVKQGSREHIGGQGKWGHCPSSCPNDFSRTFTYSILFLSIPKASLMVLFPRLLFTFPFRRNPCGRKQPNDNDNNYDDHHYHHHNYHQETVSPINS